MFQASETVNWIFQLTETKTRYADRKKIPPRQEAHRGGNRSWKRPRRYQQVVVGIVVLLVVQVIGARGCMFCR